MRAAGRELGFDSLVDRIDDNDGLFGCADHAVVEGLRHQNRADGHSDFGGFIDDGGGVAGTYAECGFARAVGGLDHARSAGGKNQVDVGVVHEGVRELNGWIFDAGDDAFRRSGGNSGLRDHARRLRRALFGARMRREDDAVAGFEGNQAFKNGGGSRIRRRNDARNETERLRNAAQAERWIVTQFAAGFLFLVLVVNVLGSEMVFDHLVLDDAHACFFDCHFGEADAFVAGGEGCGAEYFVHLLLSVGGVEGLSGLDLFDEIVQRLKIIGRSGCVCRLFHAYPFCCQCVEKPLLSENGA